MRSLVSICQSVAEMQPPMYTEQNYKCNTFVFAPIFHEFSSPLHRVDQVVNFGLLNVGPLLFNGCAKLLVIGRN